MNFRLVPLLTAWLVGAGLSASVVRAGANELTEAEKAAGWKLLFDGRTTTGWLGFKQATFPARGWIVEDGCLKHVAGGGGGDIITDAVFGDFELVWEWRLAPGANSGVKYFITETRGSAIGHEYQLLARANPEAVDPPGKHVTAGFYDVLPTRIPIKLRPPGEFNESRILVRGNRVEHWLNGELTLTYEAGSPEVKAAVAASKFKDVPNFGEKLRGHILFQDHGGEAWFRNVKLREF